VARDLRFDLVVATVDRSEDLAALLDALAAQTHRLFRVIVVDQNEDDRLAVLLEAQAGLDVLRLRSARGLSRARNVALPHLTADLVAFPDDDCLYPPDLLARVAARFDAEPALGGLSGRPVAADGRSVGRWPTDGALITADTVWHTANSHTIFLRREVVEHVGPFDEALGLGSATPFSSGEEIDYLVRALRLGTRIAYDPSVVITHPVKPVTPEELVALGRRDGGSVGYVLARSCYPASAVARMLVRPAVGAAVSLVLLDRTRARFQAATLAGRLRGLRAGRHPQGPRPRG
jgi:GT2 family glycosyltransferase